MTLHRRLCTIGIALAGFAAAGPLATTARSQTVTAPFRVALMGDLIPGGSGQAFFNFEFPVLNNAGQVAFRSTLLGGSASNGTFAGVPGALQIAALQGMTSPAGGSFNSTGINPLINDSGQVMLYSSLTGAPSAEAFFLGTPGALQTVARTGLAAPSGGNYASFSFNPVINANNSIAFTIGLSGGSSSSGIFAGPMTGLQTIALRSTAAPAGGDYSTFGRPTLNGVGQVGFRAQLSGGTATEGLFFGSPGNVQAVALEGSAAPMGGLYSSFGNQHSINDNGIMIFSANLTAGSSGQGIFAGTPVNVQTVALRGQPAPAGGNYNFFNLPKINSSNTVAFSTTLSGGSATGGLYVGAIGALQTVALEGTLTPDGAIFSSLGEPILNNSGHVAFMAFLEGSGVNPSNDFALFAGTPGGVVQIVREGQTIDVDPTAGVDSRIIANNGISIIESSGGQDGLGRSFADDGTIVYRLRFTDGTNGVFTSQFTPIPEPVALGVATVLLGGLTRVQRRRRRR
jgi:hypothetical protein